MTARDTDPATARRIEWRRTPWPVRESLLMEALGERQLSMAELQEAVEREMFGDECEHADRGEPESLARRMIDAGELDRRADPYGNARRSVYLRRRPEEAIAALERLYRA